MPYQSTRVALLCAHCGTGFTVDAHRATVARFCSSQCSADFHHGPIEQRLWRPVDKSGTDWLWTGPTDHAGYGRIKYENRSMRCHQVAWILASGQPIPKGYVVCHTCDIKPCLRNDEPGSYAVNGVEYPRCGHLFLAPHRAVNNADRDVKGHNVSDAHPELLSRGESHGRSVLTEREVRAIRADYATGRFTQADLAFKYGVTSGPIWKIINGVTWRHLL